MDRMRIHAILGLLLAPSDLPQRSVSASRSSSFIPFVPAIVLGGILSVNSIQPGGWIFLGLLFGSIVVGGVFATMGQVQLTRELNSGYSSLRRFAGVAPDPLRSGSSVTSVATFVPIDDPGPGHVQRSGGGSNWTLVVMIVSVGFAAAAIGLLNSPTIGEIPTIDGGLVLILLVGSVVALLSFVGWVVGLAATSRLSIVAAMHPSGLLIDAVRSSEFVEALSHVAPSAQSRFNVVVAIDRAGITFWTGKRSSTTPYLVVPWSQIQHLGPLTAQNEQATRGGLTFTAIGITSQFTDERATLAVIPRRGGLAVFRPSNPPYVQRVISRMETLRG
jgi:hypothetical protein